MDVIRLPRSSGCKSCENSSHGPIHAVADLMAQASQCWLYILLRTSLERQLGSDWSNEWETVHLYDTYVSKSDIPGRKDWPRIRKAWDQRILGELLVTVVGKSKSDTSVLEIFVEEGDKSPLRDVGWARNPAEDPLSAKNIVLIKSWLAECLEHHGECASYKQSRLPSRIIHVGNRRKPPRLCTPKLFRNKYVALSYCWGDSLPLTTTSSTLEKRKRSLPLDELPAVIRDAILVSRAFGIDYLWVDALCILQDSSADWARESAKMGEIYAKAFFVISADSSGDCQSGFLERRQLPSTLQPLVFEVPQRHGPAGKVYVRSPRVGHHTAVAHSSSRTQSRLSTRAWAFQERLLASRRLIFGPEEVAWECQSATHCECKLSSLGSLLTDLSRNWIATVHIYTGLKLTKTSDRLAAFSGIVATYEGSGPKFHQYVCGLWRATFTQQLLWYVPIPFDADSISQRHEQYEAPSWSWASISGAVKYHHLAADSEIPGGDFSPTEVFSEAATLNVYGSVRSAYVKARGRLYPMEIVARDSNSDGGEFTSSYGAVIFRNEDDANAMPISHNLISWNESRWHDSNVGHDFYVMNNGSIIRAWFLDKGILADVAGGSQSEICFKELHYFLPIVQTDTLFTGLVLRKSRIRSSALERVGFCSGNAQRVGDDNPATEYSGDITGFSNLMKFLEGREPQSFTIL